MKRSIEAGKLETIDCRTIIDGLRVKRVGEYTRDVVSRFVDEIVTLPDADMFDALVWVMAHCKLVVEGAAAAPVAALLHEKVKAPAGSSVVCVLSGGNLNLDQLNVDTGGITSGALTFSPTDHEALHAVSFYVWDTSANGPKVAKANLAGGSK